MSAPESTPRYALYYAPPADSPLGVFGARWLGRDAETGTDLGAPDTLPDQLRERWRAWTESPRFYGFHGTLKPPFALAEGKDEAGLCAAAEAFAASRSVFEIPGLKPRAIGKFLALVPTAPCPPLEALAAATVEALDPFRAQAPPEELKKRRRAGLSDRQEALLRRWGYPYVMEEFRFHMTLTGALDSAEHDFAMSVLEPLAAGLEAMPVPVTELVLFHQPDRTTPFRVKRRFTLRGGG
ncbi:MAG: DUF1045 domain-containing protein [Alphaproteobacteria bacterium]|nr:DUF1045 domain-containing protein [Alphaproteobacteria bacterium]